jgi:hypothetical protein
LYTKFAKMGHLLHVKDLRKKYKDIKQ